MKVTFYYDNMYEYRFLMFSDVVDNALESIASHLHLNYRSKIQMKNAAQGTDKRYWSDNGQYLDFFEYNDIPTPCGWLANVHIQWQYKVKIEIDERDLSLIANILADRTWSADIVNGGNPNPHYLLDNEEDFNDRHALARDHYKRK